MNQQRWERHIHDLLPLSADKQDAIDPWHMEMAAEFVGQISRAVEYDNVLDVGCGTGLAASEFVKRGKDYHGLTSSYADAQQCWEQHLHVRVGEMSDLEYPDDAFDLVYCRHALEHAIALPVTLCEFVRVAPVCAVAVPTPPHWVLHPGHFYTMDKRAWVHLFLQCGWEPQAFWGDDGREYRWIMTRKHL